MRALLDHPRFWLFAPFVGLMCLCLVAFGFWHMAASRITDQLAANGLSWQQLTRHGFPARITLQMQAPRYRNKDFLWQIDKASATLMPFNHGHAVFDFTGTHRLSTDDGRLTLAHKGNLMSLVRDANGLLRASFDVQAPRINAGTNNIDWRVSAAHATLHLRRAEAESNEEPRLDVALTARDLRLNAPQAARPIERIDVTLNVPRHVMQQKLGSGDRVKLQRMTLQRGALTLIARGTVRLAEDGFVAGRLDLDLVNRQALLDALVEWRLIRPEARRQTELLIGLASAFGGDTQDRLSLPLSFKGGRIFLGPIELAAAPRWRGAR